MRNSLKLLYLIFILRISIVTLRDYDDKEVNLGSKHPQRGLVNLNEVNLTLAEDFLKTKTYNGTMKFRFVPFFENGTLRMWIYPHGSLKTGALSRCPKYIIETENGSFYDVTYNTVFSSRKGGTKIKSNTTKINTVDILKTRYVHGYACFTSTVDESYNVGFQTISRPGETDPQWVVRARWTPTHMRALFPCFDDPDALAKFTIQVTAPKEYMVLSGADVEQKNDHPDNTKLTITRFGETPQMAHHLLAIVLLKNSAPDHVTSRNGVEHRFYGMKSKDFSTEVVLELFDVLERITKVKLAQTNLKKIDHIVIPGYAEDVIASYGLIIYREAAVMLLEPEVALAKQKVTSVMAYAAAYTFFGILRVPDKWAESWITEGVSLFFQYYAISKLPMAKDWEIMDQFVVRELQPMLKSEGLNSSDFMIHPSVMCDPTEVREAYSNIRNYRKGASLVRMIWVWLGDENFEKGIQRYMSAEYLGYFKNVTTSVFLDSWMVKNVFSEDKSLKDMMVPWLVKGGCLLGLMAISSDDYNIKRYFPNGYCKKPACSEKNVWYEPIVYATSKNFNFNQKPRSNGWFRPRTDSTSHKDFKQGWSIQNIQYMSYTRVKYGERQIKALKNTFQSTPQKIHVLSRAQIIDDYMEFFLFAERVIAKEFVAMFEFTLKKEIDYIPWYTALENFNYLVLQYSRDIKTRSKLFAYLRSRVGFKAVYKNVLDNIKSTRHIDVLKRTLILTWVNYIDEKVRKETAKQYFTYVDKGTLIDPNARKYVYCAGIRHARSGKDMDFLYEKLASEKSPAHIEDIIYGLGCSPTSASVMDNVKKIILNPKSTFRHDYTEVIFKPIYEQDSKMFKSVLDFLRQHFNTLYNEYGPWRQLQNTIVDIGYKIDGGEHYKIYKELLDKYKLPSIWHCAKEALERAKRSQAFEKTGKRWLIFAISRVTRAKTVINSLGVLPKMNALSLHASWIIFLILLY